VPRNITEPLDNLLLRAGVSREHIAEARASAGDGDLGPELERVAGFPQLRWAALLAERCGLLFSPDLGEDRVDPRLLAELSIAWCRNNRVLPLNKDSGTLTVATSNPMNAGPLQDLAAVYDVDVSPLVVPGTVLSESIVRAFDRASTLAADLVDHLGDQPAFEVEASDLSDVPDLIETEDEAPIIRLVNAVIYQAARDGASDIHLEPFEAGVSVRYRIDGLLAEVTRVPRSAHPALVSRIKVMASLDIAEKRLPQDGGIRTRAAGRDLDLRVSTVPTAFGERVVLRLLDRGSALMGLSELELSPDNLATLKALLTRSNGIVLATGPTGSGKTTTLYAALSEMNSEERNIITIEDPVEYQLPGIGQMQVNPKIDLDFASGLRSTLRQDPDVIMVGEIRDAETARTAMQAAMTGHLVFSTLHTNDACSAITRLIDMDIEPYLVSSAVIAVMSQRLLRRLCPECSQPVGPARSGLAELGLGYMMGDNEHLRIAGDGCESCRGTGYRGRLAIHELVVMTDELRGMTMTGSDAASLRRHVSEQGVPSLRDDAVIKVRRGLTSSAEVLRVTAEDGG
jgi:general secretion pathway protein E